MPLQRAVAEWQSALVWPDDEDEEPARKKKAAAKKSREKKKNKGEAEPDEAAEGEAQLATAAEQGGPAALGQEGEGQQQHAQRGPPARPRLAEVVEEWRRVLGQLGLEELQPLGQLAARWPALLVERPPGGREELAARLGKLRQLFSFDQRDLAHMVNAAPQVGGWACLRVPALVVLCFRSAGHRHSPQRVARAGARCSAGGRAVVASCLRLRKAPSGTHNASTLPAQCPLRTPPLQPAAPKPPTHAFAPNHRQGHIARLCLCSGCCSCGRRSAATAGPLALPQPRRSAIACHHSALLDALLPPPSSLSPPLPAPQILFTTVNDATKRLAFLKLHAHVGDRNSDVAGVLRVAPELLWDQEGRLMENIRWGSGFLLNSDLKKPQRMALFKKINARVAPPGCLG